MPFHHLTRNTSQSHLKTKTEFSQHLTARTAWGRGLACIGDDDHPPDFPGTRDNSTTKRAPFSTNCQAVACIFDIGAGMNPPVSVEDRTPHLKSRVGTPGIQTGQTGGMKQGLITKRHGFTLGGQSHLFSLLAPKNCGQCRVDQRGEKTNQQRLGPKSGKVSTP